MDKWDRLYSRASEPPPPCALLQRHTHWLPESGRALDLACGLGGNALLLARRGLEVDAWDGSRVAVERLSAWAEENALTISARQVDLTREAPDAGCYQVIVVAHFLHRPLLPAIAAALAPGGLLFYQTFSQAAPDWRRGPRNPTMRLVRGELLRAFAGLEPLHYHEPGEQAPGGTAERELATLIARRRL